MPGDLDFGNARVRALKSQLITRRTLERLLEANLDGLLVGLGATAYQADIEAAMFRGRGRALLHAALSEHLARMLRTVIRSYTGRARRGLALLTSGWDVANVITILRGQRAGTAPEAIAALLVPAGELDRPTLDELARQPNVRATLASLYGLGFPSRARAAELLESARDGAGVGDIEALEHQLVRSRAAEDVAVLAECALAPELERAVRGGIDRNNVVTTVRQWRARRAGGSVSVERADLPGGLLPLDNLERAREASSHADVVTALLTRRAGHPFAAALAAWASAPEVPRLEEALDEALTRDAVRAFVGDPLSLGVPVAYVFAKTHEVRTLRLLVEAVAGRLGREEVRGRWLAA